MKRFAIFLYIKMTQLIYLIIEIDLQDRYGIDLSSSSQYYEIAID